MAEVIAAALVVVAAAAGLAVRVTAARRAGPDDDLRARNEGLSVSELAIPLITLVALLLAFVLVATYSSFEEAAESASEEASAVLIEGQSASLLDPGAGTALVGVLQCYARAVVGPGWRALEATRETSVETARASRRVEDTLREVAADQGDRPAFARVLDAEEQRIEARNRRLAEARPTVPTSVTVLLVVSVMITVFGCAALVNRRMRLSYAVPVLAATVVIFAGSLAVIFDLDRPFGGWASIEPDELRRVERQLGELIAPAEPPCDADGVPS